MSSIPNEAALKTEVDLSLTWQVFTALMCRKFNQCVNTNEMT